MTTRAEQDGTVRRDSLADTAERLMAEFQGRLGAEVVSAVVRQAARDLSAMSAGAMGEMLERLARQRLLDRL